MSLALALTLTLALTLAINLALTEAQAPALALALALAFTLTLTLTLALALALALPKPNSYPNQVTMHAPSFSMRCRSRRASACRSCTRHTGSGCSTRRTPPLPEPRPWP